MKIAIIGGMVNNMYAMAKVLSAYGFNIHYIRDLEDAFIPHQPIWLDKRLLLDGKKIHGASIQDAIHFDQEHYWSPPAWYINPLHHKPFNKSLKINHISSWSEKFLVTRRVKRSLYWEETISLLSEADFILACGVFASIVSYISGKPYSIWAYGGDIRKLLGLESRVQNWKDWLYDKSLNFLLHKAYSNAQCVGLPHGKDIFCAGNIKKHPKPICFSNGDIIPFPAFYHQCNNYSPETSVVEDIIQKKKINILIPSRIDFEVKGHDKLLRTIQKLNFSHEMHFIFTGWGANKESIKDFIDSQDNQMFTVLDGMLSRPLLYDLMNLCDLVIDQLNIGLYGSATLEAMSFGKAVMMYNNPKLSGHIENPPVINCFSEEDILSALVKISEGRINLEVIGKECQSWAQKYHGNESFIKAVDRYISQ